MPDLRSLTLKKFGRIDQGKHVGPFDFSAHALEGLSLSNILLYPSILNIRTLTGFALLHRRFNLRLDTLLKILEESRSLEGMSLAIRFAGTSPPSFVASNSDWEPTSIPINFLYRHHGLGWNPTSSSEGRPATMDGRSLISNITLRRGALIGVHYNRKSAGLVDTLPGVPVTHPNLLSPTFMEYRCSPRLIRLLGPHGSFSYDGRRSMESPFREFPLLSLSPAFENFASNITHCLPLRSSICRHSHPSRCLSSVMPAVYPSPPCRRIPHPH